MYNIIKRLLVNLNNPNFKTSINKIAKDIEPMIKVKVLRQDLENLINPSEGKYESKMEENTVDLKKY